MDSRRAGFGFIHAFDSSSVVELLERPRSRFRRRNHSSLRSLVTQFFRIRHFRVYLRSKSSETDRTFNNEDLLGERAWIEKGKDFSAAEIVSGKRVGIDYAEEYAEKPWRFWVKDNLFVSRR